MSELWREVAQWADRAYGVKLESHGEKTLAVNKATAHKRMASTDGDCAFCGSRSETCGDK